MNTAVCFVPPGGWEERRSHCGSPTTEAVQNSVCLRIFFPASSNIAFTGAVPGPERWTLLMCSLKPTQQRGGQRPLNSPQLILKFTGPVGEGLGRNTLRKRTAKWPVSDGVLILVLWEQRLFYDDELCIWFFCSRWIKSRAKRKREQTKQVMDTVTS